MDSRMPIDMDAVIEAALRGEPLLPAPATLHSRVEERLRIAQLREQEQQRFRYTMATLAVSMLAIVGVTAVVVSFTNLYVLFNQGVSGGRGQVDAFMASMLLSYTGYSGAYSLLSSLLLAGGTLLIGLVPLWKHLSGHHPHKS